MTRIILLTLVRCWNCYGNCLIEWDDLDHLTDDRRHKCPHCPEIYTITPTSDNIRRVDIVDAEHFDSLYDESWLDKHSVLTESQRRTLYLYVHKEKSSVEVAERLDVTDSAVRKRTQRIRERLANRG